MTVDPPVVDYRQSQDPCLANFGEEGRICEIQRLVFCRVMCALRTWYSTYTAKVSCCLKEQSTSMIGGSGMLLCPS
jgi:hypothetical protein